MFLRPSLSYFCIFSEGFSRGFMLQCSRHTILIILIQCLRKNKKKCGRNRMSHKCWKQILQESLSKPFLIIIFTHFETLLLVIVFTLIVQLSVIIREYPNVLNLFLTSKSIFFVVWEWFIYKYWVLIAKCKIFSAFFFQLIFVSKRASRDGLSLNSTIMSLFFVLLWYFDLRFFYISGCYVAQVVHDIDAVIILRHRYSRDFQHLTPPILFKLVSLNLF